MIKEKGKILIIADDQRFTSDIQELGAKTPSRRPCLML